MALKIFTRVDYDRIKKEGFTYELPPETIAVIKKIAANVGAPEYIRTPHFEKRTTVTNKPRIQIKLLADTDWDTLRNFKATVLEKKKGIALSIDKIRKHLNKMTDKTYDTLYIQIIEEIEAIVAGIGANANLNSNANANSSEDTDDLRAELNRIGDAIFDIASGNSFYSKMYAKLYKNLMDKYDFMQTIFQTNLNTDVSIFKDYAYCSPDKDYDAFCKNNKTNEKRRALGLFYINLMLQEVVKPTKIVEMIEEIQTGLLDALRKENNVTIAEEMSELLYIMITNGCSRLKPLKEEWVQIVERVNRVCAIKIKTQPSISNKTIFKHMDIQTAIAK
jgi:hypothetical protein